MLTRELKYKSIYDEHTDKKNLQRFNERFEKIINDRFGDGVKQLNYGNKETGSLNTSFNTYTNYNNCSIQLDMSFKYSVKRKLITKDDDVYNDHDLEIVLNNRSQLMYVYIKGLYITPQGNGLGTYIITNMIQLLKEIPSIKFIALMPEQGANDFWKKVGFVDISQDDHFELIKSTHVCYSDHLIYPLIEFTIK